MPRTLLLSVPGLSRELLAHVPAKSLLGELIGRSKVGDLVPVWPAVTCAAQATLTTGKSPSEHGIVANGLATFRDGAGLTDPANLVEFRRQVSFWEQSNALLDAPRFWRGRGGKTALLFFQNAMPGFGPEKRPAADIVITPKPEHGADGKLTSLIWTNPPELAGALQAELGPFPLMNYWGPMAGLRSTQWIVAASAKVWQASAPDLQLTYLPHLDYDLQRFGPRSAQAAKAVVELAEALDPLLLAAGRDRVVVLSEYAIDEVARAIAPNAALLEAGLLKLSAFPDGPRIDYATSDAWVLCDHQIGHVYLRAGADPSDVRAVLTGIGLEVVLPRPVSHVRAGDTQVQAPPDAWLDYRWWSQPEDAPSWAKTVDIHRKPGYDPLELFFNPETRSIIQDASRIRGSHGRTDQTPGVLIAADAPERLSAAEFAGWLETSGL
jgi:hypothetical protein